MTPLASLKIVSMACNLAFNSGDYKLRSSVASWPSRCQSILAKRAPLLVSWRRCQAHPTSRARSDSPWARRQAYPRCVARSGLSRGGACRHIRALGGISTVRRSLRAAPSWPRQHMQAKCAPRLVSWRRYQPIIKHAVSNVTRAPRTGLGPVSRHIQCALLARAFRGGR